jgi:hypothetical protein
LRATQEADVAIVFGLQALRTGWHVPNDAVAAQVQRASDRLIFFASIDPCQGDHVHEPSAATRTSAARREDRADLPGGPSLDKRQWRDLRLLPAPRLPVIAHMATTFSSGVPLDWARPATWTRWRAIPDLKIVLAHMDNRSGETIAAIRKQPNLYADISALYYRPWQFYQTMRLVVEYKAEANLLFGSDFPATTTAASLTGRARRQRRPRPERPAAGTENADRRDHPPRRALPARTRRACAEGGLLVTLPATMRALQLRAIGHLEEVELPVPSPQADEVVIRLPPPPSVLRPHRHHAQPPSARAAAGARA